MAFDIRNIFGEFRRNRRQDALRAQRAAGIEQLLGRAPEQVTLEGFDDVPTETLSVGGTGLLADPQNLRNQLAFAAGLEALPGGGGIGLLSDFSSQASQRASVGEQILQSERESIRGSLTDIAIAEGREAGAQRRAELNAQVSRLNTLDQIDAQNQGGGGLGFKVPAGYVPIQNPETGFPMVVPLQNTKDWNTGRDTVQALQRAVNLFDQFDSLVEAHGTEITGPASAQMTAIRQDIISAVGELMNLGVLQQGDLERVEDALGDPTSVLQGLFSRDATLRAGYQHFGSQFARQLADWQGRTRLWPGMQDIQVQPLPPGATED